MRHRLRLDELERLAIARARGYLVVHPSTRTALKNAWYLDCVARSRPCVYAERSTKGYTISTISEGESAVEEVSQEQFAKLFPLKTRKQEQQ